MQSTRYSTTSRLFHWGMAVLILLSLPAGLVMVQPGLDRGLQNALFVYHKNAGVLLLVLVLARLWWRARHPAPPLPADMPPSQALAARVTHGLLYALMIVVPVAGYIRVRAGGFPIEVLDALGAPALVARSEDLANTAKTVHYVAGLAFAAVLALHIGAALYHGLIRKDGVLSRMWPPFGGAQR